MLSAQDLTAPEAAADHEPVTHAARPARGRRISGAAARTAKALLLPLLLTPGLARAEVPDGYTLVFQSGFNPGVSIAGGIGTVGGALLGAIFLGVIKNALPVINVSPFWQLAISGSAIIIAVALNSRANREKGRIILKSAEHVE